MNLADIFGSVRLNLETGEFEAQAARSADKAGASMGRRMASGIKKYAGAGIGAAFGAGLSMALSGANELDAATRQLAADAGLTATEAAAASKSMAALYRDNLQGFDEIGRAMAAVHNDLGLVGEEADKATGKFLKFATATGQDATQAVQDFDDVLDAWNLTADDAAGLMDGLIADHQEFGGVIADSQRVLGEMAPAMQAANMEIEDGRALLNLFNASGVDASKAAAALNKAVKQLKPGESLDDLIARIGAIEDPTLRAQEAMDIFGARSGIGLAQAIQPGMTSLDDFAISAENAAGATEDAARSIEEGFGNKVKKAVKGLQGTLAELGTNFGDLIMVASLLGPRMTTAILSGIGGLAGAVGPKLVTAGRAIGLKLAAAIASSSFVAALSENLAGAMQKVAASPKVAAGMDTAGKVMGSTLGKVATAAFAAIAVVELYNTWQTVSANLRAQAEGVSADVANLLTTGTDEQLRVAQTAMLEGYKKMVMMGGLGVILSAETRSIMERDLKALQAELDRRAAGLGPTVAEGIETGAPAVEQAAGEMYGPVITEADKAAAAAGEKAEEIPEAIGEGVLRRQAVITDAFDRLKMLMENVLTRGQRAARAAGILTSKRLADGLADGRPAVRAQAQLVQAEAEEDLAKLIAGGGRAGEKAGAQLAKMLKSKNKAVRDSANRIRASVVEKLEATKKPAGDAGAAAGDEFNARLRGRVGSGSFRVNASVRFGMQARAAGGPVSAGVPYWTSEKGPEIYVPGVNGRILSHEDSMRAVGGGGGGGDTYNIPLTVQGALPVRTIRDLQLEMERIGDLGAMPPRFLSPAYRRSEAAGVA